MKCYNNSREIILRSVTDSADQRHLLQDFSAKCVMRGFCKQSVQGMQQNIKNRLTFHETIRYDL